MVFRPVARFLSLRACSAHKSNFLDFSEILENELDTAKWAKSETNQDIGFAFVPLLI
jgi:hypothetical protein